MRYLRTEINVNAIPLRICLDASHRGFGLLFRYSGRPVGLTLLPAESESKLDNKAIAAAAAYPVAHQLLERQLYCQLSERRDYSRQSLQTTSSEPSLTIAICTKDRAVRLHRLLQSLHEVCSTSPFPDTEILVVDNASVDKATRDVVHSFPGVRYTYEPKAGLNFARNAALHTAAGDLIAYLDDDVVVDPGWLTGLQEAWCSEPSAGGFTGLVLPYRLDTAAQIAFEQRGGFGRGFSRREFSGALFDNTLFPVGAGVLGAGCNMAFRRQLLIDLGGFDDALDTGAPLPGGGDLDMFYRVLRSGHRIVYDAGYAVFHEHRETMSQLRHQYWTWGLGFMSFLVKSWRSDPQLRSRQFAMIVWWLENRFRHMGVALIRRDWQELRFSMAEFTGGIVGLCGEYDRSRRRIAAIRGSIA